MFEVLIRGFKQARNRLQGKIELTESTIDEALKDIRVSLLEADVHYKIVKDFLSRVKEKALGEIVQLKVSYKGKRLKVSPADHFINICYKELEALMGPVDTEIKISSNKITSIMLVGLQGCGKTTTAGKLALFLKKRGHNPLLVAAGPYRPAAVEQLQVIGQKIDVPVFFESNTSPVKICSDSLIEAQKQQRDIVIFDTAGRLTIDETLMEELEEIVNVSYPENILLVCDAMIGQDAVNTALEFNKRIPLTGFILTKLDGDARGGAALSIKEVTGKPIKFLGIGESLERLEEFRPEGLASRILGFGDVVGLMKEFEEIVDEKKAEEDAIRMLKGEFTLVDFLNQIKTIKRLGPLHEIMEKLPLFSELPQGVEVDDKELVKIEAIINSMTVEERIRPDIIDESRKRRIALGSGRSIKDVTELLNKFKLMRDMMRKVGKSEKLLRNISGLNPFSQTSLPTLDSKLNVSRYQVRFLSKEERRKLKAKRKKARKDRKKARKRKK
ncbi:MAG: signal recognition particle protein [Deltaproteobacteria bacterium]|nr:MAG: signal recognition particle protein [Deltaproteobacteria bacterium]